MSFFFRGKKFDGSAYDSDLLEYIKRDVLQESPDECLDDIVELKDAKKILKKAITSPFGPKAVLMVGPPGTGKTKLAKAVIANCNSTFFHLTAKPSNTSKFFGKSEKSVQLLLEVARFYAPSTIFIDMIESCCSETIRRVKELLMEMKGITSTQDPTKVVTILANTNLDLPIDKALIRSFDKIIYIPLLKAAGRHALIKILFREVEVAPDVDFEEVANRLEGYCGEAITRVCRNAAKMGMRRRISGVPVKDIPSITLEELTPPVSREDFRVAIADRSDTIKWNWVIPNPNPEQYEKWMAKCGSA